ncbi:MAG: PIG-L family deacetylase [Legionella sp.]|nr:PIG-L family deacetylase [Legionella sp.]
MKKVYEILLIEDNITLAKQICGWLGKKANVVHVTDFNLAKELAHQNNWHIVITDFNIAVENGLEIIQIVKKTDSNTAVLIIAENVKVEFILHAMQHHADGLLFKPLDKNEFCTRVFSLAEESKLKKSKKIILAIGAHPDDVEFGCGGTLAKLHSEGNSINIATLSLGKFGGEPEVRKKEATLAAQYLDANLYLGNFADTKIAPDRETILFLEKIIQKVQPTHVYTHSFHDSHQDHRNIYQATITACRQTPNIFSYQSPSATTEFRPNSFININNFIERKLKILSVFESQNNIRPYLQADLIRATARYWGRFSNYQLVEPMEVIKGDF